ncbi:hypothetical protein FGIG_00880, partial [Fasciola gigantica]
WFTIFLCTGGVLLIVTKQLTSKRISYQSSARSGPDIMQTIRMTQSEPNTSALPVTHMEIHSHASTTPCVGELRRMKHLCARVVRSSYRPSVQIPTTITEERDVHTSTITSSDWRNHSLAAKLSPYWGLETTLFRGIFIGLALLSTAYFCAQISLCIRTVFLDMNISTADMAVELSESKANQTLVKGHEIDTICAASNALSICLVMLQTWVTIFPPNAFSPRFDTLGFWLSTHLFGANLIMFYISHGYPATNFTEGISSMGRAAQTAAKRLLPFVGQYHILAAIFYSRYCFRPRAMRQNVRTQCYHSSEQYNNKWSRERVSINAPFTERRKLFGKHYSSKWQPLLTCFSLILITFVSGFLVVISHFAIKDLIVKLLVHHLLVFSLTAGSISLTLYYLYRQIKQYNNQSTLMRFFPVSLYSPNLTVISYVFVIYTCFVHVRQIMCILFTDTKSGSSRYNFAFFLLTHSTLLLDVLCQLSVICSAQLLSSRGVIVTDEDKQTMSSWRSGHVSMFEMVTGLVNICLLFCYATVPADIEIPCANISPCCTTNGNQTNLDITFRNDRGGSVFRLCSIPYTLRIIILLVVFVHPV